MAKEPYLVLARKWRPQTFEEVLGQDHITRTLQNAIRSGRISHAFLFVGTRGVGKTTTARLLARALNCTNADKPTPNPCGACPNCTSIAAGLNIDVVEIDGASNNSVDDVRAIRENIRMVPAGSRYKIYIVDEVHQLSSAAFNALLKTLEEPPTHGVFILATTDPQKLPLTIVSRCQRYDFRRVGRDSIVGLLRRILEQEGVECEEAACLAIARAADGSVRDAQSVLEQLISYCGSRITFQDVFHVLGLVDWQVLHTLCDAILSQDIAAQLRIVEEVVVSGKELSQFVQDILQYLRHLLVCKTADPAQLLALPEDELAAMEERAHRFSLTTLIRLVEQFAELSRDFDSQLAQRIALESLLIRISKVAVELSVDTVLEKLMALGAGGIAPAPHQTARPPSRTGPAAADAPDEGNETVRVAPAVEPEAEAAERVLVTPHNMAEVWRRLAQAEDLGSLNLRVNMNHARPMAVEGERLVLCFPSYHTRARSVLERGENRALIEEALGRFTQNLASFRTELAKETPSSPKPERDEGESLSTRPVPSLKPEELRAALEDPHIAQVVEVFKGAIVDIKHHTTPPAQD